MKHFFFLGILSFAILFSCSKKSGETFVLLTSDQTGIDFENTITETMDFNSLNFIYIYNGAGTGAGDINNDGLPDLFFAGNMVPSKLYLNKGNMKFEDITSSSGLTTNGWVTGVSMVDINADGFLDLYLCLADKKNSEKGQNQLYINQGDNTFKEEAKAYGLNDQSYSTQAAFFDYDLDGDLDMYLLTNGIENFAHNNVKPRSLDGQGKTTDKLYKNNGNHTFTNVSQEAGITIDGFGLSVAILDVNEDGWPDIYCSNDFLTNDLLWLNNGDGTFTESIKKYMSQTSHNGMGMDVADFNNDALLDIVQMDMLPETNLHNKNMTPAMNYNQHIMRLNLNYMPQYVRNTLQLRNKNNSFSEIGRLAGMHKTDWSWTPLLADFDNDGLKDLFISNGYGRDITDLDFIVYSESAQTKFNSAKARDTMAFKDMLKLQSINLPNYFFKNNGDLTFTNVTKEWTSQVPSISNGSVYVDLDLDGDLDIVTNNTNSNAFIYKNTSIEKQNGAVNFLKVALKGADKNRNGLGAEVTIFYGDTLQMVRQYPTRGYISSVDQVLHFGLGKRKSIDSLKIVWPDGKYQKLENITANKAITLSYKDADSLYSKPKISNETFLVNTSENISAIKHIENKFIDFQGQPLLLKMLSREGPGLAVADVNNDGLDDFFMATALNDTSYIYLQHKNGSFYKGDFLPNSWNYEDQGCVFADFNMDNRMDLYVTSGGNELPLTEENYRDRLYLQSEEGKFVLSKTIPSELSSTATVNAADFDNDGHLDLFVGSRLKPNSYPFAGKSYILKNDGGKFTNVTASVAPGLEDLGLITSALWTDFNNDGKMDLIVVGEWMEISFFENTNGKLINNTGKTGLKGLSGLWNSIHAADFDHDGDTDYIVGNLGINTELKASEKEPVTMLAKDFDENESVDPIMGYYVQGENHPLATRDALISQISAMKKRFPHYNDYATAKLYNLFSKEDLVGVLEKKITNLQSIYIENKGDGTFIWKALPLQAQMAPIYGMEITDLNNDSFPDILLTGNRRDAETLSGYLDGSIGTVLLGNGEGDFKSVDLDKSGFVTPGDTRGIVKIVSGDNLNFLVANNNDALQSFSMVKKQKLININQNETYAIITLKGGATYKEEFYFGSGYLSQSSRILQVPLNCESITIYNAKKENRKVSNF